MSHTKIQKFSIFLPIVLWVFFVGWWLCINILNTPSANNYTDTYGAIALTASVAGFVSAKKWGLFRSRFGAVIGYISLGLFLQFLGNFIYTMYFRIGNVELAFPSVGDIPYVLTSVAYIFALYNLLKIIVVKGSFFKPWVIGLVGLAVTVGVAVFGYLSFLHLGIHDDRGTIFSLANIAYPLIQTGFFLLGFVALLQAKRMAGGKMFAAVCVLLVALIMQYASDFSFLYQDYHNTWQPAGWNDLLYASSYGLMALSILMIERVRNNVLRRPIDHVDEGGASHE